MYKRVKLDPFLTLHTKIHSKWIKVLNTSFKIVKLLEKKNRGKLQDIDLDSDFMDITPKTWATK